MFSFFTNIVKLLGFPPIQQREDAPCMPLYPVVVQWMLPSSATYPNAVKQI